MKKILTVTLNPAIDVRYNISNMDIGKVNRISTVEKKAGGKGINVSRVIKDLGGENILATGIVGGFSGKLFLSKLNKDNIQNNFLETENETRTCIALIEEKKEGITEFLEAGIGSEEIFQNFLSKYISILDKGINIVCASGSLLKGLPENSYNILIKEAKKRNIKFILDTSGLALMNGIKEKPFLIKPNKEELETILNLKFNNIEEIIEASKKFIKNGIENIMVTLGGDGALLITKEKVFRAVFPKIKIKNTVGSGDSTIGGLAYGLASDMNIKECFKLAIACGTTNAMLDTTGNIDKNILNEIFPKIKISEY